MRNSNTILIISSLLFLLNYNTCSGQEFSDEDQKIIDSLNVVYKNSSADSSKVNALTELVYFYYQTNIDTAIIICKKARDISIKANYHDGVEETYGWLGYLYQIIGNMPKAIENLHKCLEVNSVTKDKESLGITLNSLGYCYANNPGTLDEGLVYYRRSLNLRISNNDVKGVAFTLNNIGGLHKKLNNKDSALYYYTESLKKFKEINHLGGIANQYNNIGSYFGEDNKDSALYYYEKSRTIFENNKKLRPNENTYSNIAAIQLEKGNLKKALAMAQKSYNISKKKNDAESIYKSAKTLRDVYEKLNNIDKAYALFKEESMYKSKVINKENKDEMLQKFYQFEYDKKAAEDSLKNAKDQEIKDAKIDKQKADLEVKKNQQYALFGGLGLVLLFTLFIWNRFRVIRKQKVIIEEKEKQTQAQNKEISLQKEIVEEKNTEILDSINYAKRLQNAILPPMEEVEKHFPSSFILFRPKDIVSGDFYWMETKGDQVFLAAADCTGHGVPGAMVSVVCANALNKAVNEMGKTDPADILNVTRDLVIATFAKAGSDVKDGMDISLIATHKRSEGSEPSEGLLELSYAGANNPLWIIRNCAERSSSNDANEIEEIKANKQPIGKMDDPQPFVSHEISLQKGDSIYLFSDGFQDQFGGEKGKKFKSSNLKKLLLSVQTKNMEQQKELLDESFNNWKGLNEQLDDVCVIGIKV